MVLVRNRSWLSGGEKHVSSAKCLFPPSLVVSVAPLQTRFLLEKTKKTQTPPYPRGRESGFLLPPQLLPWADRSAPAGRAPAAPRLPPAWLRARPSPGQGKTQPGEEFPAAGAPLGTVTLALRLGSPAAPAHPALGLGTALAPCGPPEAELLAGTERWDCQKVWASETRRFGRLVCLKASLKADSPASVKCPPKIKTYSTGAGTQTPHARSSKAFGAGGGLLRAAGTPAATPTRFWSLGVRLE